MQIYWRDEGKTSMFPEGRNEWEAECLVCKPGTDVYFLSLPCSLLCNNSVLFFIFIIFAVFRNEVPSPRKSAAPHEKCRPGARKVPPLLPSLVGSLAERGSQVCRGTFGIFEHNQFALQLGMQASMRDLRAHYPIDNNDIFLFPWRCSKDDCYFISGLSIYTGIAM